MQDGIDPQEDQEDLKTLRQRHDVMMELLGFDCLADGAQAADDAWPSAVTANENTYAVVDKYPDRSSHPAAKETFDKVVGDIDEVSMPFQGFRSLPCWVDINSEMEGMKTATSQESLKQLESTWQDFKSLVTAFVAAYKNSCKVLKDRFSTRERASKRNDYDAKTARNKHLVDAKAKAEKSRQERVKDTIKAADGSAVRWFPLSAFKNKEHFMLTFEDHGDFESNQDAIDWNQPWQIKNSADVLQLVEGTKGHLGRFKYHMRKARQWNNMQEGRVWAPLIQGQSLPELNQLCDRLVGNTVDMMQLLGAVSQFMDSPWLHGMREDKVFSSNTPQFVAALILCASGRQDIVCAPFSTLMSELPAGLGGDVDALLANLEAGRECQTKRSGRASLLLILHAHVGLSAIPFARLRFSLKLSAFSA